MTVRRVIRWACGAGLVHFSIAVLLWLLGTLAAVFTAARIGAGHMTWSSLLQSLPAVAFLAGFYFAFRISPTRPRIRSIACAFLFLAAAATFYYDTSQDRYQVQTLSAQDGCSHFYVTWFWWAYDR